MLDLHHTVTFQQLSDVGGSWAMDEFWGLTATGWTAIYNLLTPSLLAVAVAAGWYASHQWQESKTANLEARTAARGASQSPLRGRLSKSTS